MARQIMMDPGVEFIVGGDFNRHDSHWGGDWVADTQRQGEGEAIVDLMIRRGLQSLLPRGTVTWERDNGDAATTIDLSLASGRLADERVGCAIWPSDYGSDHRHIHTTYSLQSPEIQRLPRLLFKEAEWDRVRRSLQEAKHREPCPGGLDDAAAWLQRKVTEAVEEHCPRARPSPYVKRWWTPGLTYMRKEFTSLRNRARRLKYQGRDTGVVDREAATAKHRFANEIEKQKKDHWNQFLDEPTNIWKVAKYLDGDGQATFSPIQRITKLSSLAHAGEQGQDHNRYVTDNEGIAAELLASFFPPTAEPSIGEAREYHTQLPHEPLQKHEVERALWAANQDKAPGPDGLPMRVWREVWPVLQDELTAVMSRSLQEARLPDVWKKASIVPLRKAGREDYTSVKSYRPISLLQTVSKILESVVAERVSYLVETHGLLPRTHFGARKQRSSTDALVYLQEKIYDAWRGKETLSLVSFDVKGAYNNVAKEPELHRLRKRGIPEQLVRWIDNYCTGRRASVVVNGHRKHEEELPHSGLPQGSPLSPILFLFFNADLLEQAIPNGGTMAFVDDYTAWVVGASAEDNTNVIQQTVLPRLKEWEESSGAVFEASKTVFVHYTRSRRQGAVSDKVLTFKGEDIKLTCAAKILGVIMDSALKFRQHLARASKRAVAAAQAVRRMKNMRPSTTRQLVSSMVFPVVDYASVVWSPGATDRTLAALKTVQRTSAQAVIHGFRTVSLEIAETEAALPTTKQRLRAAATRYWIRAQALPRSHPVSVLTRARPCVRFNSPLQKVVKWCAAMRTRIEPIPAFSEAPWDPPIHTEILDKEQAKNYGEPLGVVVTFYTDASIREGSAAIGVWHQTASSMRSLGPGGKWTVVHAEMEALIHAAEKAPALLPTVLYTDSKQAIRNLNDRRRSDTSQFA